MPFTKQYFSLPAINEISEGFSYKNGQSKIRFSLSSQLRLLERKTLRLTGRIVIYDDDDDITSIHPQKVTSDDTEYFPNHIHIPNFGGLQCLTDRLRIQSKKSNQELSTNTNYSQITAVKQAYSHNKTDYRNGVFCQTCACGPDANVVSRRLTIMTNPSENHYEDTQQGLLFTLPIEEAMLNKMDIMLNSEHVDGLLISFDLKNDADFFNSLYAVPPTNVDISGSYYRLKDVRLEGRYIVPTPEEIKDYPQNMVISEFENLLNDIQSSTGSTMYTPNFSGVQAMINLFQPTDQRNNYDRNLVEFTYPYGLVSLVQGKNSRRYPYDYTIDVTPNYTTSVDPNTLEYTVASQGDAEVRLQFLRTMSDGSLPFHQSTNLELTNDHMDQLYSTGAPQPNIGVHNNLLIDILGIGTDYTHNVSGQSENYSNKDYSLQITSGINTGSSQLPARSNQVSMTQETFVKHLNVFDFRTLNKMM